MFHLITFASSTPGTYGNLTNVAPPSDPVAATSGNFLFVPTLNQLIGAYAVGTNVLRMQISTPSLLADVPYDVTPVDTGALPSASTPLNLHPEDPIALVTDEPMQVLVTTGGTAKLYPLIWVADGALTKVSGRIIRARATFTTGTTLAAWNNASLTLQNQLAEGTYNLVGARVEGTHIAAARFVFPGGSNNVRPGMIASNGANGTTIPDNYFRNGNLGVWGSFSNRVLPTIDHLTDGTSETATLILDLIKQ